MAKRTGQLPPRDEPEDTVSPAAGTVARDDSAATRDRDLERWPDPEALLAAWRFGRLPQALYPAAARRLLAAYGTATAIAAAAGVGSNTAREWVAILTDDELAPAWVAGELSWTEAKALAALGGRYRSGPLALFRARRRAGRPVAAGERQRLLAGARVERARRRADDRVLAGEFARRLLASGGREPEDLECYRSLASLDVPTTWLAAQLGLPEATVRRRLRRASPQSAAVAAQAVRRARAGELRTALEDLPPRSSGAIEGYLALAELDLPRRELADELGIHRDTLRRRLARAEAGAGDRTLARQLALELRGLPGTAPATAGLLRRLAALDVPRGWLAELLGIHRETLRRRLARAGATPATRRARRPTRSPS